MTGITVSGTGSDRQSVHQRIATWGYDQNGKGVLSVKGALPEDGKPGLEQVTFDRSQPGQTTLTNSLGQKTVYRYGILGGQWRLTDVRGAGCASCGPANVRYGRPSHRRPARPAHRPGHERRV